MTKYGAAKIKASKSTDGLGFDSKLEAYVYMYIKAKEQAGEWKLLRVQEKVYLTPARILIKPDFTVMDVKTGETFFVEAKGMNTPVWMIKKRLWPYFGPARLLVFRGRGTRVELSETITPIPRQATSS